MNALHRIIDRECCTAAPSGLQARANPEFVSLQGNFICKGRVGHVRVGALIPCFPAAQQLDRPR
ncbi:MAG: hypothetical protein QHJ82_17035, partial [Verrucomicrobiota bacterium]|nr:hypothetical protein [Verrucomicrobiota bacterium]